jgi:gas vesicle protein
MRKFFVWLIGLTIGAAAGAGLVALFAPATGKELKKRLGEGYAETLDEARAASQARQAELEARLARLQKRE